MTLGNPLVDVGLPEVPLANAPLVRVIAQVRFPEILSVEKRGFVAPFQEALRQDYPVFREEKSQSVFVGRGAVRHERPHTAWRLSNREDSWRVTLTSSFVSLETNAYSSQTDFLQRLALVLTATKVSISPASVDRLGIRYIDRIVGEDANHIGGLVRPEVLGVLATETCGHVLHSLTETLFRAENPDCIVLMRTGALPANAIIDLTAVEPVPEKSWILDLDAFGEHAEDFDVDWIVREIKGYSARIYAVFRWVVTKRFLEHFGGVQ